MRTPPFVAISLLVALGACDQAIVEDATPSETAPVAAAAPLTAADGEDRADHACEIVLREATSADCVRSQCRITVRFDVQADLIDAGAAARVLFTSDGDSWWAAEARATGDDAAPGFARFEMQTWTPSTGRYRLIPFYTLSGARVFDHNVVVDDVDSYVLDQDAGFALFTGDDVCPGSEAGGGGPEVRLIHAWSNQCPPVSGCAAEEELRGLVEVANLAYDKRVEVVYDPGTGAWVSAAASYVGPSRPGFELWAFDVDGGATAFALSYAVDGRTYWDNNGGQDYRLGRYGIDAVLAADRDLAIGWARDYRDAPSVGAIDGAVVLRNHSYDKTVTVTVRDTASGASAEAPASYYATLPSGLELWRFTVPFSADVDRGALRLSARFAWDGGEASDDDFGRGYRLDATGLLTY